MRHLEAYDIINLQEMFGLLSFRQRRLIAEAEKKGFVHAAVAGAPTYLFWDKHWSFKLSERAQTKTKKEISSKTKKKKGFRFLMLVW